MRINRFYTAFSLFLLSSAHAAAQSDRTEVCFDFRVNSSVVDSLYRDNAIRLREMTEFLRNVRQDSTLDLTEVSFRGAASPEDSYNLNHRLARERLAALESIVKQQIDVPDSIISRDDSYIPWDYLRQRVQDSDIKYKDEIIAILNEEPVFVDYHRAGEKIDRRVVKLQRLHGGKAWQNIYSKFFADMRNAYAVFVTCKKEIPKQKPLIEEPKPVFIEDSVVTTTPEEQPEMWIRRLHVKTNAVAWGFGMVNAAVEIDIAKHWSFTLPVYWSSWNYFKSTRKFRTLTFQPEVRYWLSENNTGFFVGAHFGLGWYNFATDGKYRTQDHDGSSPAPGGGLAIGYRLPLSHDHRWNVEFTAGAGAYRLHHDKFLNEPNGLLVRTEKKTYFGLDQAAITFSYAFGLNKKGGNK